MNIVRYKKILVPVDGSENAKLACCHAAGLASACGAAIVLMHCYGTLPNIIGGEAREEVVKDAEEQARGYLAPCEAVCKEAGVPCTSVIKSGDPARVIIQVATTEKCDLIAMGTRGLSEIPSLVLGSVSHDVLEYSTIPVLLVK